MCVKWSVITDDVSVRQHERNEEKMGEEERWERRRDGRRVRTRERRRRDRGGIEYHTIMT